MAEVGIGCGTDNPQTICINLHYIYFMLSVGYREISVIYRSYIGSTSENNFDVLVA